MLFQQNKNTSHLSQSNQDLFRFVARNYLYFYFQKYMLFSMKINQSSPVPKSKSFFYISYLAIYYLVTKFAFVALFFRNIDIPQCPVLFCPFFEMDITLILLLINFALALGAPRKNVHIRGTTFSPDLRVVQGRRKNTFLDGRGIFFGFRA